MKFPTPEERNKLKKLVERYRSADGDMDKVERFTAEALKCLGLDVELCVKEGVPDHFRYRPGREPVIWLGTAELEVALHEIGHACFGKSEKHAQTFALTLLI